MAYNNEENHQRERRDAHYIRRERIEHIHYEENKVVVGVVEITDEVQIILEIFKSLPSVTKIKTENDTSEERIGFDASTSTHHEEPIVQSHEAEKGVGTDSCERVCDNQPIPEHNEELFEQHDEAQKEKEETNEAQNQCSSKSNQGEISSDGKGNTSNVDFHEEENSSRVPRNLQTDGRENGSSGIEDFSFLPNHECGIQEKASPSKSNDNDDLNYHIYTELAIACHQQMQELPPNLGSKIGKNNSPKLTYKDIIKTLIIQSEKKMLLASEILKLLIDQDKTSKKSWNKNCISNVLSRYPCFERVAIPGRKKIPSFWSYNAEKDVVRRRRQIKRLRTIKVKRTAYPLHKNACCQTEPSTNYEFENSWEMEHQDEVPSAHCDQNLTDDTRSVANSIIIQSPIPQSDYRYQPLSETSDTQQQPGYITQSLPEVLDAQQPHGYANQPLQETFNFQRQYGSVTQSLDETFNAQQQHGYVTQSLGEAFTSQQQYGYIPPPLVQTYNAHPQYGYISGSTAGPFSTQSFYNGVDQLNMFPAAYFSLGNAFPIKYPYFLGPNNTIMNNLPHIQPY